MLGTSGVGKGVGGALCALDVRVVAVKGCMSGENKTRIVSAVGDKCVIEFNLHDGS
jgi:hypothetical protein